MLGSSASTYDKTIACKELAHRGDAGSVPAIARLLAVPELNHPARIALENIPAAAAGEALIAALDTTKGPALVGVINSLGGAARDGGRQGADGETQRQGSGRGQGRRVGAGQDRQ